MAFLLWLLAFGLILVSLTQAWGILSRRERAPHDAQSLRRVAHALHRIEDALAVGHSPTASDWEHLSQLPGLWGSLCARSLLGLRSRGAALLPTLRRLRSAAEQQREFAELAEARTAQARVQAWAGVALVPIWGYLLHSLLPGVSAYGAIWLLVCAGAWGAAWLARYWMQSQVLRARWAGLARGQSAWLVAAPLGGELFLAFVRASEPPDLAWLKMIEALRELCPTLVEAWGAHIWSPDGRHDGGESSTDSVEWGASSLEEAILQFARDVRLSIQVSLMEGKPALPRIEALLQSFGATQRSFLEKALSVLPTRVLQPLFVGMVTPLLGLLVVGFGMSWQSLTASGSFF